MTPILIHMVLILDLTGCLNAHEAVKRFLDEADLAEVNPTVDMTDNRCIIRYTINGPETLTGLRQTLNRMARGLFSDATKAAIKNLRQRPSEFTVEMLVPPSGWRF